MIRNLKIAVLAGAIAACTGALAAQSLTSNAAHRPIELHARSVKSSSRNSL
jgi:hypothetical protein